MLSKSLPHLFMLVISKKIKPENINLRWPVSPHDHPMERFEEKLQTMKHDFHRQTERAVMCLAVTILISPCFCMLCQIKKVEMIGFPPRFLEPAECMMNCPTWTHGGWLQRETLTNLFSEAFFVYSARWWSLSYFSTSCQQLSRPLSPGQCSAERPHLWVGRSGKDAGHSTINLDSVRNPGHCPGGEFGTQRKNNQEEQENIPALQMLLSSSHSFNFPPASSYPPCRVPPRHKRHGVYEICLRWMIADWIHAYWTLNICNILQYHYFPP